MKLKNFILTVILVLCLCVGSSTLTPAHYYDAPGGWEPWPVGSGWCRSHGVTSVYDGTIARCQQGK